MGLGSSLEPGSAQRGAGLVWQTADMLQCEVHAVHCYSAVVDRLRSTRLQLAFLGWACIVLLIYGLSILLLRASIKPVGWWPGSNTCWTLQALPMQQHPCPVAPATVQLCTAAPAQPMGLHSLPSLTLTPRCQTWRRHRSCTILLPDSPTTPRSCVCQPTLPPPPRLLPRESSRAALCPMGPGGWPSCSAVGY